MSNQDIFEKLMQDETYRRLLEELPEDERAIVKNSLKELVEMFENNLINPIKNMKGK